MKRHCFPKPPQSRGRRKQIRTSSDGADATRHEQTSLKQEQTRRRHKPHHPKQSEENHKNDRPEAAPKEKEEREQARQTSTAKKRNPTNAPETKAGGPKNPQG